MLRTLLALALAVTVTPALAADDKEVLCGHQADIVAAIAQARLDRVRQRNLEETLAQQATWPEDYNQMIPILAPHMYGLKRKDIRSVDWRDTTFAQCMSADLSSLQSN